MMNPIHFATNRRFWLVRALGAVVMTAAAVAMARAGLGTAVGWTGIIGVVFFGVGAVICLIQGMRVGPRLTLDAEGVHDRALGVGVIAWSDITSTAPYWVAKMPFIGLHLREPAKYVARASAFKRMLARINSGSGMPAFSLNLPGVDADPTYVAELVTRRRRKSGRLQQDPAPVVESDDEWDGDPPSAERVARRALVLAALAE